MYYMYGVHTVLINGMIHLLALDYAAMKVLPLRVANFYHALENNHILQRSPELTFILEIVNVPWLCLRKGYMLFSRPAWPSQ